MIRVLFSPFLYKMNCLMRVNAMRKHWRASIEIPLLLHYLQHTFALKLQNSQLLTVMWAWPLEMNS